MRKCERCGDKLPAVSRSDARFCSTRCRVAAHRASLPRELRMRPRWVRYSARKVPLTVAGGPASSTDPATWSTYAKARASKVGVGLGFVLDGDGIVCLDLDHCLIDETPSPAARDLLERLPATYIEVSPSGDGLHVWGRGTVRQGRRVKVGDLRVEIYGTGRYLTVTGRRFGDCPSSLAGLDEVIATFL